MNYFITYNGQTIGPMTKQQIFAYPVTPNTPVCTEDNQVWQPLYTHPDLMELLSTANAARSAEEVNTTGKDKVLCGIFAILFGGIGVQYFYLGKVPAGLITIVLSLITCGLWSFVTFIQGIVILTMTQQQFEQKYVLNQATFPLF